MGSMEDGILHSIVDIAIKDLSPAAQAAQRQVAEIGSAHIVVLLHGAAAVRIGRDPRMDVEMRKRQELVDSIPVSIGFHVPRSLGPVVTLDEFSAVAVELVPGAPCPAGEGEPSELQDLLARMSSIPTEPISGLLAEPLAFCGGPEWYRIQREEVLPRLKQEVQRQAMDAVRALVNLEPVKEVFAHGDLGGHNVFWEGGRMSGVLDWDLSSRSDLSTDLACVGVWNGWKKLSLIADAAEVRRASVRRNTFRLQQLAFAVLHGRPPAEIDRAVSRANAWFEKQSF
ncbi:phosphotransferase [Arthrobacter zhangbolii]|uniref:phosphotransferase n=1 Tax=Arthrobacter zhangbolii TaxID=2886936 RepID=UPI001D14D582|nr:phosphotransferase [Arthrobacter zhangbolii]